MAVGDTSEFAGCSYLMVGRETTFKTYNTCTANLDFISSSLKTVQENKVLEQIETSRTFSKRISMMKKIEGDIEFYANAQNPALAYILENAFGANTVTSATATGETTNGLAFTHTFNVGKYEGSYSSLCINMRKGGSAGAYVTEYSGIRVNELSFTAELDEALKASASLVGVNSTQTSNDLASIISVTASDGILNFTGGRVSVETTFASITSTSFWHVQSVNFGLSNSLKSDAASGRIGSAVLDDLPFGILTPSLTLTMRFNTTTAFDAMLNETQLSVQLNFEGTTLATSVIKQGLKLNYPKTYITTAGDPEVGGPDEFLTSEVEFHILQDDSSNSGYAIQALLTNDTSSYT